MNLSRRFGPSLELDTPGTSKSEFKITKSLLQAFEVQLGLSARKVESVKKLLKKQGAKTAEPYLKETLAKERHALDEFYDYKPFMFKVKTVYNEEDEEEKQLLKLEKKLAKDREKQRKFEFNLSEHVDSELETDETYEDDEDDEEEQEAGIEDKVDGDPELTERICVIANNVPKLVELLIEKRELDENCKLQIGIDGMYKYTFHSCVYIFINFLGF